MAAFPDYRNPPVAEVVLGVQFAPLAEFSAALVGLYWAKNRQTFPTTEQHPPVAHQVEQLGEGQTAPRPQLEVEMFAVPPLPRIWFLTADETMVVQLQDDRFLYSWRKRSEDQEYPRFPSIKEDFTAHWTGFRAFLQEEKQRTPAIDQCEVTYVNIIKQGEGWETPADVGHVLTTLKWSTRSGFLPPPEAMRWGAKFVLPGDMGRMHVDLVPVVKAPAREAALRLTLTVRGSPGKDVNDANMAAWFDLAHEWIVKGFADLVDQRTDLLWGKRA